MEGRDQSKATTYGCGSILLIPPKLRCILFESLLTLPGHWPVMEGRDR